MSRPGRLFLIPVPIASDTPLRADDVERVLPAATLSAMRSLTYFLVEDARPARGVLKAAGHPGPIADLRIVQIGHSPDAARIDEWLRPVRSGRVDAGVMSEAGCPGIADPGAQLVARAHALGIEVVPLVGPSAPTLALMASGLNGQQFRFLGYLPRQSDACAAAIRRLEQDSARAGETQLFIETPYRAARLMDTLLTTCGRETLLHISADLTGARQYIATRSIAQWRDLPPAARPDLARTPSVFALLVPQSAASPRPAFSPMTRSVAASPTRPAATRSGPRARPR